MYNFLLCTTPRSRGFFHGHLCPAHLLCRLLQWSTWSFPWRVSRNFIWLKMWWHKQCDFGRTHITLLLHEMVWLPVSFWVQFKILVLCFKPLHDMGLDYLRDCLSHISTTHLTRSSREGVLWVSSACPKWCTFSMVVPTLWNIISPPTR